MRTSAKIKVIKKGKQVDDRGTVVQETKTTKEAAREIVTNVTNWVNEFQQRRRSDTKQAIEKLFSPQTQTSEV